MYTLTFTAHLPHENTNNKERHQNTRRTECHRANRPCGLGPQIHFRYCLAKLFCSIGQSAQLTSQTLCLIDGMAYLGT